MKKIKFRAWDKENEIMVFSDKKHYDYWFDIYEDGLLKCLVNCSYCDSFGDEHDSWEPLDNLMQYTGLKDKNGKEIYEGDIIKYSHSIVGTIIREVRIKYGMWGIEGMTKGTQIPFANLIENEYEVIGNIYENPELLG